VNPALSPLKTTIKASDLKPVLSTSKPYSAANKAALLEKAL
jgi:hypothetical protein